MPELTEAEATVLDMLAKSTTPWVRRSLADLVAGRGVVDGLVGAKLIEFWTTNGVGERKKLPDGTWAVKARETPTIFVALTSLGLSVTNRDVFERTDGGRPVQGHRRRSKDRVLRRATTEGTWVLPDGPIRSLGGCGGANICPDIASGENADRKAQTAPSTRRERRAKRAG